MSCIQFSSNDFYNFVKHHISLTERFEYGGDKDFSIIFFKIKRKEKNEIAYILENILRKTDAIFNKKSNYMVILPGTDWNGAYELLCGIQKFLGENEKDTIVSYPDDGKNSIKLLTLFSEKIEKDYSVTMSFV